MSDKETLQEMLGRQEKLIEFLEERHDRWRKRAQSWEGKFHQVRRENNKLRRALYNKNLRDGKER